MGKYLFIMSQEGLPWGGSEPLWSQAAEKLARRGNEVVVSSKDWDGPVPQIERLRAAGCKVFYRHDQYGLPPFFTRQFRRIFPPPEYRLEHIRTLGKGADLVVVSQGDNADGVHWLKALRSTGHKYAVIAQSAVVYWWPDDDTAESL